MEEMRNFRESTFFLLFSLIFLVFFFFVNIGTNSTVTNSYTYLYSYEGSYLAGSYVGCRGETLKLDSGSAV